jgi:hypothetical protein
VVMVVVAEVEVEDAVVTVGVEGGIAVRTSWSLSGCRQSLSCHNQTAGGQNPPGGQVALRVLSLSQAVKHCETAFIFFQAFEFSFPVHGLCKRKKAFPCGALSVTDKLEPLS